MYVEQLSEAELVELINLIQEATNQTNRSTESDIIQIDTRKHSDGLNYRFVKTKNFMKCWMSDFTCATRFFDASIIYRVFMGKKFGQEYIDSFRSYREKKAEEKIKNEMKHLENMLNT